MQIPLDYYRILGLPIQATVEQLKQAHHDRTLQLPRREYSEAAIAARKHLLDEAYTVLSDSEQRQTYDASFLAKTHLDSNPSIELPAERVSSSRVRSGDPITDPYAPAIEVPDEYLIGGLLILLELGEYELVLKIGRLQVGSSPRSKRSYASESGLVQADIVLTVALSCLELGREQWQQGQYENAAESLQVGQDLLLREGIFANVRGEIQADLYKLRPYRVLELLALPQNHQDDRRKGTQLLRDMLHERGGIDGNGNDQSGLDVNDFLRFIQQLRSYLTVAEQQTLFEEEARRPSAVATYLAVYALLARGFAQRQPALIRRAKLILMRLATRQDVYLEQSVCALLLGQTEEASRALERSHELEPLAFIREHSQGSPDLLPGLCLYSERWLQEEVLPHFQDLASQHVALKDYFADDQVQAYLEELPNETVTTSEWVVQPQSTAYGASASRPTSSYTHNGSSFNAQSSHTPGQGTSTISSPRNITPADDNPDLSSVVEFAQTASRVGNGVARSRVSPPDPRPVSQTTPQNGSVARGGRRSETTRVVEAGNGRPPRTKASAAPSAADSDRHARRVVERTMPLGDNAPSRDADDPTLRRPHSGQSSSRQFRLIMLLLIGLLGVLSVGFLVRGLMQRLQTPTGPVLEADQPILQLDQPPIALPTPTQEPVADASTGTLTKESAQQVLETWLTTKAVALGPDHAIDKLDAVLAEPVLSQWQKRADEIKQNGWYREFKHSLTVDTVQLDTTSPDQAKVEAEVGEETSYFEAGQFVRSQTDNVRVRYDLVRKDGQWRIQDWVVLR